MRGIPTVHDVGVYEDIVVTVSDGTATSTLPAFSIEVLDVDRNSKPYITPPRAPGISSGTPNPDATAGELWTFGPYAWDHNGDPLEFSAQNLPDWLTVVPETGRVRGTPTADDVGVYEDIIVSVSDGTETASLAPFTIEVRQGDGGLPQDKEDKEDDEPGDPAAEKPQPDGTEDDHDDAAADGSDDQGDGTAGGDVDTPVNPPPAVPGSMAFIDVTTDIYGAASCRAGYRFDFDFMDANGDGLYDLFVLSHEGVDHCLYVQRGDGSGTFEFISGSVANYSQNIVPPRGSSRATFIDLDGDAREDITTTEADIAAASFANATETSGGAVRFRAKTAWCAARDFCNVGDLDGDDRLDKVRGDRSIESIVSGAAVVGAAGPRADAGWSVVDLDGDSWPDLVDVASGGYWRNVGGTLEWQAVAAFAACTFGRHQDFADFDRDGDLDLACTSGAAQLRQAQGSRHLLRNDGDDAFTDVTGGSGFEHLAWLPYYTSYSNSFAADLDNDAWVDYVIAGVSYRDGVQVLRNLGGMKFERQDLAFASQFVNGGGKPRVDIADYDHDGWLDLLLGSNGAAAVRLYRNVTTTRHNWLKLRLSGDGHNSMGLNSTVRIYRAGTNELLGSYQVLSHADGQMRHVHGGLGDVSRVDVQIVWPHGSGEEWLRDVDGNQQLRVRYRAGGSDVQHGWTPGSGS